MASLVALGAALTAALLLLNRTGLIETCTFYIRAPELEVRRSGRRNMMARNSRQTCAHRASHLPSVVGASPGQNSFHVIAWRQYAAFRQDAVRHEPDATLQIIGPLEIVR